jgi:putative copper export protein
VYRLLVILHLLGATIWVGGHLVLSLVVLPRALRARDPSVIREFETGYQRIGLPALLLAVLPGLDATTLPLLAYHVVGVTVLAVALLVAGVAIRTGGLW